MMIELFVYILPKIISWAMGGMHVSLLGEYGSDGFDSHGVMALVDLCQAGELLDRCVNLNTQKDTEEAHH